MLDTVWVVQVLGICVSLPLILGLFGCCIRISKELWPYLYLTTVYVSASMLTWQASFELRWLAHSTAAFLVLCALYGIIHLLSRLKHIQLKNKMPQRRFARFSFAVLSIALCVELLFAAFPGYRYDQYNYHLVTPKLISLFGKLPPYIGTDHTHFTGAWEYFFTVFRTFLSNDLLIQTCTTTFTFLSYVIPAAAILWQLAKPARAKPLWLIGLPTLVIYAHSELEPVISAKPDFVLVASALAIVAAQSLALNARLFFTFFFLLAGLSFKVTWIHAGLALGVGVLLYGWRDRESLNLRENAKQGVLYSTFGALLGAACTIPVFYKNTVIFGNPIHPTQAGPFKSRVATESFISYWEGISGRPVGLTETLTNILKVFPHELYIMLPILPVLLLAGLFFWKEQRDARAKAPEYSSTFLYSELPWIISWFVYLIVWGIILRHDIYNRFVAVGVAFPLILIVKFSRSLSKLNILCLIFLIPFALNSSLEVKLRRMWRGAVQNYAQYSIDNFSPSIQDFREAKVIHAHALKNFGEDWNQHCQIFTNKPNHYFFDTRFVAFDDQNFEYHIQSFGIETFERCPWAYFQSVKACFLLATHELEFADWPSPMAELAQAADENLASGENTDLRLLYVSPNTLRKKIDESPGCIEVVRAQPNELRPINSL